jgi:putative oxidoreductase
MASLEAGTMIRKMIMRLAQVLLGGVFLFAGAVKAVDPATFAVEIHHYQLIPWRAGAAAALIVPWLEMLSGVLIFVKRWRLGALVWITSMLAIFTAALASAALRGLNIDCGCFGRAFQETGTIYPLVRNVALLGLAAFLWTERGDSGVRVQEKEQLNRE